MSDFSLTVNASHYELVAVFYVSEYLENFGFPFISSSN